MKDRQARFPQTVAAWFGRLRTYYFFRHVRRLESAFEKAKPKKRYVAFVDLLGFGSRVRSDFRETIETYQYILVEATILSGLSSSVNVRVYSDAFLLTAEELGPVVFATNQLHMSALRNGHLLRGGISYGDHLEVESRSNLFVVSSPLVSAVELEKNARHPCVVVDPTIELTPEHWGPPEMPNLLRQILYFEGRTIVNPCSSLWGTSARLRVEDMLIEAPDYAEKYQWFLRLHEAIFSDVPLIPKQRVAGTASLP